jgi:uncharacterized protein YajQ (UPF0234 family)
MADYSFDIVSEVNLQEVDNALNQTKKELSNRYDFRNSKSTIEFDQKEKKITIVAEDDFKLRSLKDILNLRLAKRGISIKSLTFKEPEKAFSGMIRQVAQINMGIPMEKAKELVKIIKDLRLKVQAQIQNDQVRVSSPKKDDLQAVIFHLKSIEFSVPLQFTNYR